MTAQVLAYSVEEGRVYAEQVPDWLHITDLSDGPLIHVKEHDGQRYVLLTFENGTAEYIVRDYVGDAWACELLTWRSR